MISFTSWKASPPTGPPQLCCCGKNYSRDISSLGDILLPTTQRRKCATVGPLHVVHALRPSQNVGHLNRKGSRRSHSKGDHHFYYSCISCCHGGRPVQASLVETETDTQVRPMSRTQRIMEGIAANDAAGGAGGTTTFEGLKFADMQWGKIRNMDPRFSPPTPPNFVKRKRGKGSVAGSSSADSESGTDLYDVVICGGTLGVFIATALALQGTKVAIVERGKLVGRAQEWNISRKGLLEFVKAGVLTEEDIESVVAVEFNPNRVGTKDGEDIWVEDILNLGVSPAKLIDIVKQKFLAAGGVILEKTGVSSVEVFDDEVRIALDNRNRIRGRLVLDAMGNASPIVRQIRWGQKPDGVCLVVGSCARGFKKNDSSDVLVSTTSVMEVGHSPEQLFWEAFPAGSGPRDRTTYLFSYMDATKGQPSLEDLLETYWDLMPEYQGVKLEDLEFLRVMYGFFTTYRDSPLPSSFDRVVQIGDASGIQSPLSFGGFGSVARHLRRLSEGLNEALEGDILDAKSLSLLNPYMPNLSGTWLFQRAMSVPQGSGGAGKDFINELLAINFQSMKRLGDHVLLPFLEDVIKFGPLARTMASIMFTKPTILPAIFKQTGVVPIFDWLYHFIALGMYTFLSTLIAPRLRGWINGLDKRRKFIWNRRLEAWEYGAGLDYRD